MIEDNVKASRSEPIIVAENLTMAFGDNVIQRDLTFTINRGDVFIVMGASGCGKSTLMKNLIGLQRPAKGNVFYGDTSFWDIDDTEKQRVLRRIGVMYQGGALWSSMTLAENIMLIIQEYLEIDTDQALELASLKLALVGLAGFEQYYPSEISGGMKKRVAIARAISLNPKYLFCDEPNSGLDPQTGIVIDNLIKNITEEFNITTIVNTHDMNSVMEIGDNIALLHNGLLAWEGSNEEVLTSKNEVLQDFVFASPFLQKVKELHT